MSDNYDVLIVGAGHAGAQAAITLRQQGFSGTIALISDEPELPYERPPLSKEYLSGVRDFSRILLRPEEFWTKRRITMHLGIRATRVLPEEHIVELADGSALGYRTLIWATGGTPRKLNCPGHDLDRVHAVRTRADVDRIISELESTISVAIIGGGYIGLEMAAGLIKRGKPVIVLETLDRVLARVAAEPLSRFYETEHRAHGVDIRLGVRVERLIGQDGRITGLQLADGEIIRADMVIVGIGITPNVEPLLAAGAVGGDGVMVDGNCRTSLPGIYAIGDCALHINPYADGSAIRLESIQNANDQAAIAAKSILGSTETYQAVPWFWSSQYDLKLQTVGLSAGHEEIILRGEPSSRSFSLAYLKAGRMIALDCVNATKDYVQARAIISGKHPVDIALLEDAKIPLGSLKPN